jgi:RNA polymerase sigma-70 factor (ECF subfamily)
VEVADLLETTVPAVNSALQRARATLDQDERAKAPRRDDEGVRALLARYIAAWERGTPEAFAAVLREDAVLTMPPVPSWFRGIDEIAAFVRWLKSTGDVRMIPAVASGGPALAGYVRAPGDSLWRPVTTNVFLFDEHDRVREVHAFMNPDHFARFGLPPHLT